ncbi:ComEA family DNA-binding protein [Ochrovirga pacifica]|uniref:ComEA family DNA-binding protein n=1 Tax=Ochrovirga pacifica TaxID=1042376 RepID=UPI0002558AD5|nr:helix-hairpin-helix domain-containing protein [Ochrovirga pacifica]
MKRSLIKYTKSQRNGIFALAFLILLLQLFIWLYSFSRKEQSSMVITQELQQEIHQLRKQAAEPKRYTFNPNYISDYKAYQLGISAKQIDRLFAYRQKGKYVNSGKEFQEITQISDSLLKELTPYFKFPDWVKNKKTIKRDKPKKHIKNKVVLKDINKATTNDLKKISGIGEKRAATLIKYRNLLGGFASDAQLKEVWGIPEEVLVNLQKEFRVLSAPEIQKIDVNLATLDELKGIVYINYKQAKSIVIYRSKVGEIKNLAELKTIRDFPVDKYELISLYLHAH